MLLLTERQQLSVFICFSFVLPYTLCLPFYPTNSILLSLTRVLEFYKDNIGEVNVDAIFGVQVVKGALSSIINSQIESVYTNQFKRLHRISSEITSSGIHELLDKDDPSLDLLYQLIANEYPSTLRKSLKVNTTLTWPQIESISTSLKAFGEKKSDECFGEVLRTIQDGKCSISSSCVDAITTPRLRDYAMLHQLMFSQLVSRSDSLCANLWQELLSQRDLNSQVFEEKWCTNSLKQMERLIERTHTGTPVVQAGDQDLFFEHLFVCPSSGYGEFLKPEYLDIIIQSQDSSGCWNLQDEVLQIMMPMRKLLTEKELLDGCLYHKTSVALAALSQYLLLYLSTPVPDKQPRVIIPQTSDNSYYYLLCSLSVTLLVYFAFKKRRHCPCT